VTPPHGWLPKLVATDLDGTLVRDDDTVSEHSHATLARLRANGVVLVGATGRGPRLIELCLRDLGPADYLVLAQGGYLYDVSGPVPHRLYSSTMPSAAIVDAVSRLEAAVGPLYLAVEALEQPYSPLWRDEGFVWPYREPTIQRDRTAMLAGQPLIKAFLMSPDLDLDALLAAAREVVPPSECEMSRTKAMIEIAPPGRTKATGLAMIAELLGIDPSDVLVFGDMPNDQPMFEWAGYRVAVAGAHPDLLALADEVTGSNNDDGVAAFLDRLLEG
jgi:Cof subfamily protein (haloacid dehalogenase superfamily)